MYVQHSHTFFIYERNHVLRECACEYMMYRKNKRRINKHDHHKYFTHSNYIYTKEEPKKKRIWNEILTHLS